MPNTKLIDNLVKYFSGHDQYEGLGAYNLSENYSWPKKGKFPSYAHFPYGGDEAGDNYKKNIKLKEVSSKIWDNGDRLEVAKWVISDWGGIRGNKQETIEKYVTSINEKDYPTEISGVASYSKILSFMSPMKFAIYDARVAISLNALQLLQNPENGVIFRYLPGRNSTLAKFRNNESTSSKALSLRGWDVIQKDECYEFYLNVLKQTNLILGDTKLYELEMALFADAERLALRYLDQQSA